MRAAAILLWWVAAMSVAPPAIALEPVRPGQEAFLRRAAFAGGRLWLLSDAGQLSSIAPYGVRRIPKPTARPVLDICTQNKRLVAILAPRTRGGSWAIRRWTPRGWSTEAVVKSTGDVPVGLACERTRLTLLTTRRLIDVANGRARVTEVGPLYSRGFIAALHGNGDGLYVGFAAGEWGGGLRRIDRRTGEVALVEAHRSGNHCKAPLDAQCDPVLAITPVPWQRDCVAAAIGLSHMGYRHGRIVEVCDRTVTLLHSRALPEPPPARPISDDLRQTVPFYALSPVKGRLVAIGNDGITTLTREGAATTVPLPKFKTVGGIAVSFAHPGMALVLTAIHGRLSVGGAVPLLVPR